jgi:MFS family permease
MAKKMVAEQKKDIDKKIKKSLFYSIVDGSFWSVMYGIGENYLSAFAVFLKASNFQIGLLSSLPLLLGSLLQYFSTRLTGLFGSRKRFVVLSAFIQALTWLPMLAAYYFGKMSAWMLIFFAVVYYASGMIASPAWNSWIGDLVNPKDRGRYFGKRSRISGIIILFSIIGGGIVLDLFKDGQDRQFLGFAALFIVALIARLMSTLFLSKKYEPEYKDGSNDGVTFVSFIRHIKENNYGLFVLFMTLMNFAVYVASPFFTAYLLYDLRLSYFAYMILTAASFITRYLALPVWGKLSDKYGNKIIMTLCSYMIGILPLTWLFSTNVYYLFCVQLFSGIIWGGFELTTFNFVLDTTAPDKRTKYVSYYNMINGVMIFLGTLAGTAVIKFDGFFISQFLWSQYYLAFIVSGVLRIVMSAFVLSKVKEVRKVGKIGYEKIFGKAVHMIMTESMHTAKGLIFYPVRLTGNLNHNSMISNKFGKIK